MKKNKQFIFANIFPVFFKIKNQLALFSLCAYIGKIETHKFKIKIEDITINPFFLLKNGIKVPFKNVYINFYHFKIEAEKCLNLPIQNSILVTDDVIDSRIVYNLIYFKKSKNITRLLTTIGDNSIYFRQSVKNTLKLTVRKKNITDSKTKRVKIFVAYIMSKIFFVKNKILLYEKENQKYEESASVVYENLIDKGKDNVYFILDKNSSYWKYIDDKYKKNIIYSHSFKHYFYFFRTKTFMSSESLQHSMDLRVYSKYVNQFLSRKKFKYVFLQHGVMYMVSLNSSSRSFFQKGNEMPLDSKVVVSSKKEADHFIEYANYNMNDLYITGLPKFDRSIKHDSADKITIMPTWRPWEYNLIRNEYKKAPIYKMVKKIINSIPEEYSDKIQFLPHPLIKNEMLNSDLSKYIPDIESYDQILKNTELLITDYSSISYDAFYRGSNVIFYWEEKDKCLKNYDGDLMLKESETFGPICYNKEQLSEIIHKIYGKKQEHKYKNRFKKIVEFDDNNNTERLISMLEEDDYI